jgi:thiol-disulfide isomerase/thioredoxin
MKKTLIYLIALTIIGCSNNSNTINGSLANGDNNTVLYLEELFPDSDSKLIDSCKVIDGQFNFNVEEENIGIYKIYNSNNNLAFVIIKKGDVLNLDVDLYNLNNYYGNGSEEIEAYIKVQTIPEIIKEDVDSLKLVYQAAEGTPEQQQVLSSVRIAYDLLMKKQESEYENFIYQNSNNFASFFALMNLGAPGDNYDIYKMVVDSLEKSYPKNKWVTNIKQTISSMKATAIGATAPDFTINDVNGNPFTLSSLRGSYVFIDFWASWCKPCRDENPNLVRMYNKYKDKDFEIVGISLDDTIKNSNGKEKWINAIQQDNIKWIQLSELNGNESITSKLYNISSIPATFLIDKEGKIIAKDIRGTQLNKTLSEIF